MSKIVFSVLVCLFCLACSSKKTGDPALEAKVAGSWTQKDTERYTEDGLSCKDEGVVSYEFDASKHEVDSKWVVKTYVDGMYVCKMTANMSGEWYASDGELYIKWDDDLDINVEGSLLSKSDKREMVDEIENEFKHEMDECKWTEKYDIISISDDMIELSDDEEVCVWTRS